jgi:hypothetical protein
MVIGVMTNKLVTGNLARPRQILHGQSYVAGHNSNLAQFNWATYMGQAQKLALLSFFISYHIWLAKWAKHNIWPIYILGYNLLKSIPFLFLDFYLKARPTSQMCPTCQNNLIYWTHMSAGSKMTLFIYKWTPLVMDMMTNHTFQLGNKYIF